MSVFLGMDGGGTKTNFALQVNGRGFRTRAPGGSFAEIGGFAYKELIRRGTERLFSAAGVSAGDVASACWGIPCYGERTKDDEAVKAILRDLFPHAAHSFHNDVEIAMYGALAGRFGVHIVAGTGAIAAGYNRERMVRTGGWHEAFSDEGSGYWLGQRALSEYTKQADGRLAKGPLFALVQEYTGTTSIPQLIKWYEDAERKGTLRRLVASLQLCLHEAARLGDPAGRWYTAAGKELAQLATATAKKLDFKSGFPVTFFGGVFKGGAMIIDPFKEEVEKRGGIITEGILPPDLGSILIAKWGTAPENLAAGAAETALLRVADVVLP